MEKLFKTAEKIINWGIILFGVSWFLPVVPGLLVAGAAIGAVLATVTIVFVVSR